MNARLYPVMAGILLAVFSLGLVAPKKAQANDLGKVLLGVAAGVILYNALTDNHNDHNRVYVEQRWWDGGHNCWMVRERYWDQGHSRWAVRDRREAGPARPGDHITAGPQRPQYGPNDRWTAPQPQPKYDYRPNGRAGGPPPAAGRPGAPAAYGRPGAPVRSGGPGNVRR